MHLGFRFKQACRAQAWVEKVLQRPRTDWESGLLRRGTVEKSPGLAILDILKRSAMVRIHCQRMDERAQAAQLEWLL